MNKNLSFTTYSTTILSLIALKVGSLLKVSFIIGSFMTFFSMTPMITPLSGLFGGLSGSCAVFGIGLLLKLLFFKSLPLKILVYHVPGFFGALYLARSGSLIRLWVPLICMLLFIVHPVGGAAWVYSLYWLIPVILYFLPHNNLFLRCLGSTFVAHAVGSVMWLYMTGMPATAWLALIPVVAAERLTFAAGTVVLYKTVVYCTELLSVFVIKKSYIVTS